MKQLARQIFEAASWVRDTASKVSVRRDRAPIDTIERVDHFARTRAAFVSQKKLYGYLKERIGTRFPKMFDDEVFAKSINIAKVNVFAASLADLTCFCVANATTGEGFENADRTAIARACYRAGIEDNASEQSEADKERWIAGFEKRLERTVWSMRGEGGQHFIDSAPALISWAPIAEELKRYDREIVENSIRYAWIDVRLDFMRRLDADSVARDWTAQGSDKATG